MFIPVQCLSRMMVSIQRNITWKISYHHIFNPPPPPMHTSPPYSHLGARFCLKGYLGGGGYTLRKLCWNWLTPNWSLNVNQLSFLFYFITVYVTIYVDFPVHFWDDIYSRNISLAQRCSIAGDVRNSQKVFLWGMNALFILYMGLWIFSC